MNRQLSRQPAELATPLSLKPSLEEAGEAWSAEEEAAFKAPIRQQYETQGSVYYSSARLWDDGVVEPAATRDVLGLSFAACMGGAGGGGADRPLFRM